MPFYLLTRTGPGLLSAEAGVRPDCRPEGEQLESVGAHGDGVSEEDTCHKRAWYNTTAKNTVMTSA
jgi:hypothetical protein